MVRHRSLPAAPLARLLTLLASLAAAALSPAWAITGGSDTQDPDGIRRLVVQILGPGGEACTGTIVGPDRIVSAAHCFPSTNPHDYTVLVLDRGFHRVAVKVASVRVHPAFDRQALQAGRRINDLAVLHTAPLPGDVGHAAMGGFGGRGAVTAAGFGEGGGWFSHGLRQVDLTALDTRPTAMGDIILGPAGAGRAGACAGDSGGPVLRRSGRGYVLVGVISWTDGQCGTTTAVTPVSMYQPFLAH